MFLNFFFFFLIRKDIPLLMMGVGGKMGAVGGENIRGQKISFFFGGKKNPIMKQADQETKTCGGFEVTFISCVIIE